MKIEFFFIYVMSDFDIFIHKMRGYGIIKLLKTKRRFPVLTNRLLMKCRSKVMTYNSWFVANMSVKIFIEDDNTYSSFYGASWWCVSSSLDTSTLELHDTSNYPLAVSTLHSWLIEYMDTKVFHVETKWPIISIKLGISHLDHP